MDYTLNIPVILAIVFFVLLVIYKERRQQHIDSSELIRIALSAMALPNLLLCLFYLVANPSKAMEMVEAPQYLAIAVLVIFYLSIKEIKQTFEKNKDTS